MAYSTVTLTGTYQLPDKEPASGSIEIIPSVTRIIDAEGDVILAGRVKARLDEQGSFSVDLPATDDTTLNPTGFGYTIAARLRHMHLDAVSIALPAATPTVDMADVTPVDPATFDPDATYAPLSSVTKLDGRVDDLENAPAPTAADIGALPNDQTVPETVLPARLSETSLADTFVAPDGTPADGDALVWDAATSKWKPGEVGNAGLEGRVTDLETNTPTLEEQAVAVALPDMAATVYRSLHVALFPSRLEQVSMSFGAGVAASSTDYWTVYVNRIRNGSAATIASKSTRPPSTGEAIAAWRDWNFDLITFDGTADLVKSDVLCLGFVKTGAPADLVGGAVSFRAPAADVVAPAPAIVSDSFNRADAGSLGTADVGGTWETSTNWTIAGNTATSTGVGSAVIDSGVSDCTIDLKVIDHSATTGSAGIVFRYTDDSNYWGVTNSGVFKRVDGVVTNETGFPTIWDGSTMRAVLSGDAVSVYEQIDSVGEWVLRKAYTGLTFNQTATRHGLRCSNAGAIVDDFTVTA